MARDPLPNYRSLLRELFWTKTGLLVLAAALLGISLLILSATILAGALGEQITLAVGTGLLAAAIFTTGQLLIVGPAANSLIIEAVSKTTHRALRDLVDEHRSMNTAYLPTHVFEGTPRPDPAFNRQLMRDLLASEIFLFRGLSARHSAARLLVAPAGHWEFRAVIADPRAKESLHQRAGYLSHTDAGKTLDEVYQEIRHQVCYGLVGLYLARLRCNGIFLTMSQRPSLDRFEIFDNSVWITLYSDASQPASVYPRALRFHRSSFVYAMQRRDFQRAAEDGVTHVIESSMTEAEFLGLLAKLTGEEVTVEQFRALRDDFNKFRRDFEEQAYLSGDAGHA